MTESAQPTNPTVLDLVSQSSDLEQISTDLGEVILDQFLSDGLAKDIPVLSTIFGVVRAAGSYSNYLLAKKIALFLKDLDSVPLEQRQKQIERLISEPKFGRQVADNLMLVLDRLNDMSKPTLLANAWRAYLEERIDREMLFRFTRAIELLHVADLNVLHDLVLGETSGIGLGYNYAEWKDGGIILCPIDDSPIEKAAGGQRDWDRLNHLATCGLLLQDTGRGGGVGGRHAGLRLNEVGRSFYINVVNPPPSPPPSPAPPPPAS